MEYSNEKSAATGNPPPYSAGGPDQASTPLPTVVVGQPVPATASVVGVVVSPQMGPQPSPYLCKTCNAQVVTRVERRPTTKTHLFAALLCLLGCWCCVCVPYCVDSCQNADHYCPKCNTYIGSYIS